jgi:uncharacterized membrane protein YphA (DoxX/SURF4 family)
VINQGPSWLSRLDQTGIPLLLTRLLLGGMLIWLGTAKIADDPVNFLKLMREYHLLDEQQDYVLMNLVAAILPWIETVCGIALVLGVAVRGAGLVSAGMLAVFTPMILVRGLELYHAGSDSFCQVNFDCGCGAGVVFLCAKLLENVGLFLLAIVAAVSRSRRFCLSSFLLQRPQPEPAR